MPSRFKADLTLDAQIAQFTQAVTQLATTHGEPAARAALSRATAALTEPTAPPTKPTKLTKQPPAPAPQTTKTVRAATMDDLAAWVVAPKGNRR